MSILSSSSKMGTPILHEFKKQASFFFRETIKTARLTLTDVTPAQLMTEEATDGNPWAPDSRILRSISLAAFERDDYCRIIEILLKRFSTFDKKNWRVSYNSLIVLQHLLTHGPESVAKEFQDNREVFIDMGCFQYIDEKGFNWGLAVRKKSERILKLLEMGDVLKEERDRGRKVSRGIQGFGSFCHRSSPEIREMLYERSNSQCNNEKEVNGGGKKVEKLRSWYSFGGSETMVEHEGRASLDDKSLGQEEESFLSDGAEGCGDECRRRESVGEEEYTFYGNGTEKYTCYSPLKTDEF